MGIKRCLELDFKKDWLKMILHNAVEYGLQVVLTKHPTYFIILAIVLAAI
jgi:hypothetical protein